MAQWKAAALLACVAISASAQVPSRSPSFEVASIKPADPGARSGRCTGGPGTSDPGLWTCTNYSLAAVVELAFDLKQPWMAANLSSVRAPG